MRDLLGLSSANQIEHLFEEDFLPIGGGGAAATADPAPPPEGADTQYIDTRAIYDDLSPEMKERVENLEVDHDLFRALQRNGVEFEDEEMRKNSPRMTHRSCAPAPMVARRFTWAGTVLA